ncbi:uncharacterized protein LOC105839046 isoform X1 [Monomorium pharaonis]|uniref:uncharacterized protein LOC105839046 isoform X1 n=2 Tax=Monomorium pharaonis TaxID=307658 RepID=UPI00063F7B51|nr:uncharacterized protein LOC105839046 isoform X1 [Monomorium pharaonis]
MRMEAEWNQLFLERPPCTTWQITPLNAKKRGIDVSQFKIAVNKAIEFLSSNLMYEFTKEYNILRRQTYRGAWKFRNEPGFKAILKLRKALENVRSMFLENDYETLKADFRVMKNGMYTLPSRERLEYVLMRTDGFNKLLTRIKDVATQAAHFWKCRMATGHFWSVAAVNLAITSRLRILAEKMSKECLDWYDKLSQCKEKFEYVGAQNRLSMNPELQKPLDEKRLCFNHPDIEQLTREPSRLTENVSTSALEDFIPNNNIDDIGEVVDREAFEESLPSVSSMSNEVAKCKRMDATNYTAWRNAKKRRKE